jgi:hypothetical protein
LQEAEKRQKIRELMLDSTIFSVITHALLTESRPRRKACRITETPRSAQIAQLVEQRIENPRVRGSNPRLGTTFLSITSIHYSECSILCVREYVAPYCMVFANSEAGVLKVDGTEVANAKIPHTIPELMPWDETFDVGVDTRTSVEDKDYQVPFPFNGNIAKLEVALQPSCGHCGLRVAGSI